MKALDEADAIKANSRLIYMSLTFISEKPICRRFVRIDHMGVYRYIYDKSQTDNWRHFLCCPNSWEATTTTCQSVVTCMMMTFVL